MFHGTEIQADNGPRMRQGNKVQKFVFLDRQTMGVAYLRDWPIASCPVGRMIQSQFRRNDFQLQMNVNKSSSTIYMFVHHLPQFEDRLTFHSMITQMPSMAVLIRKAYLSSYMPINFTIDIVSMSGRDALIIVRNTPQDVDIPSIK